MAANLKPLAADHGQSPR